MQVFSNFKDLPEIYRGCAIALGTFDGIHLGHIDIINTAIAYAKKNASKAVVFSFSNHPLDLIAPEKAPPRLCSEEKKKELLAALGVDVLFNMHFDEEVAAISSDKFVLNIKEHFAPGCIVVGDNYSYGYLGAGTAQTLIKDGEKYGFDVIVHALVKVGNTVASSTNIRQYILQGHIKEANSLLGRDYSLAGVVIGGDKRGRTLGFPTANLDVLPFNQAVPGDGVYAGYAKVGQKVYQAVTSIGHNLTFATGQRRIETHLLDFEEDIYGEGMEVFFQARIRDMQKFASVEELVENIGNDVKFAKKTFTPA